MNQKQANPEMIILARESRGLTQRELAEKLDMSPAQLSRIEVGLRTIQKEQLTKLSSVLSYPASLFVQQQPMYGLGISEFYHRKHKDISDRLLNQIYARIHLRLREIEKLMNEVDIGKVDIKPIQIDDFNGDAAEVARLMRVGWHLPHGPISNLIEVIEDARGMVIPFDFGTNRIDAISHWNSNGMPPVFFVNTYSVMDRLRFTIAHELGHVIMHQSIDPDMEHQADEFASEFLMPARDIKPYLIDISLAKLADLKRYWKVSMAALLKRATDLEMITPRKARSLWVELGKAGYRRREPPELDLPRESPTLLQETMQAYTDDMGYSVAELARMLNLTENETIEIYFECNKAIAERQHKAECRAAIREVKHLLNSSKQS
jgi:Zn-dependent peptidase ImmA (M78 family)/DNA-binding XRE family transcriptional regulator